MARLILLTTPIGNMADLTARVKEALQVGVHFAVEDSRTFREMLHKLGIDTQSKHILSLHDQSSQAKWDRLIDVIHQGQDLYVCSEAGSPVLSDPAFPLVRLASEKGIPIESYSGISSVTMALELSALPPLPFQFHGFLPRESGKIAQYFLGLGQGTHIFFEAANRLEATLEQAVAAYPDAEFAVVKEMTKSFERVWRFKAQGYEPIHLENLRGEFVWLMHLPNDPRPHVPVKIKELAQEMVKSGANTKSMSKLLGEILDRPSKEIYSEISRGDKL
ncbi:MAG: SAM-dependent methyltransferase [Proteobacteria bacterium]|nr:SAM-dependent methyltransferase [Pseudomonadota bacterium]